MSFDWLAPVYDSMEVVTAGRLLQRVRTASLDALAGRRRILSVGEGHGRFAASCAQSFPDAELTCVEASGAMLSRARRRVANIKGARARVNWVQAKLPAWRPPAAAFDAIVTCFFLDCFPPEELAAIVATLAHAATANAAWLIADFTVPARGIVRWRAQAIHAIMYTFFRFTTDIRARRLTPPDSFLAAQGFSLARRQTFDWGLLRADLWRRGEARAGRDVLIEPEANRARA
jgi:ubiquinone/menaquinone biosynthesis C-methylase UbiE